MSLPEAEDPELIILSSDSEPEEDDEERVEVELVESNISTNDEQIEKDPVVHESSFSDTEQSSQFPCSITNVTSVTTSIEPQPSTSSNSCVPSTSSNSCGPSTSSNSCGPSTSSNSCGPSTSSSSCGPSTSSNSCVPSTSSSSCVPSTSAAIPEAPSSPVNLNSSSDTCRNCRKVMVRNIELQNTLEKEQKKISEQEEELQQCHQSNLEQEELLSEALEDNLTWRNKFNNAQSRVKQQATEIATLKKELREALKGNFIKKEQKLGGSSNGDGGRKVVPVPVSISRMVTRSKDKAKEEGLEQGGSPNEDMQSSNLEIIYSQVQKTTNSWITKEAQMRNTLSETNKVLEHIVQHFQSQTKPSSSNNQLTGNIVNNNNNAKHAACQICNGLSDQIQTLVWNWTHLESEAGIQFASTKEILLKFQEVLQHHTSSPPKETSFVTPPVEDEDDEIESNTQEMEDTPPQPGPSSYIPTPPPSVPSTSSTTEARQTARSRVSPVRRRTEDDGTSYLAFSQSPPPPPKRGRRVKGSRKANKLAVASTAAIPSQKFGHSNKPSWKTGNKRSKIHGVDPTFPGYKCKCGRIFSEKYGKRSLQKHVEMKQRGKVFSCTICNKLFARPDGVTSHMKHMHYGEPIRITIRPIRKEPYVRQPDNNIQVDIPSPPQVVQAVPRKAPGELSERWLEDDGELRLNDWVETFQRRP